MVVRLLILLGLIVAVIIMIIGAAWGYEVINHKRIKRKYPDFDRDLNSIETAYIQNAQVELKNFAENQARSGVSYILVTTLVSVCAMFASWAGLLACWYGLVKLRTSRALENGISQAEVELGVSAVIGVFTGIIIAGYLSYFVTRKHDQFNLWMVLNSGANNRESPESILQRRLQAIEFSMRRRELKTSERFIARQFLLDIVSKHQRAFRNAALISVVITFGFAVFDLT